MNNPITTPTNLPNQENHLPVETAGETVSLRHGTDGGIASEPATIKSQFAAGCTTYSQIGKYVVERLLGQGGQAQAWLAHDPDLRRQVVLKLYHAARTSEEKVAVLREGRALAQVRHPAVAQCLGADRHEGVPYLIVEYVAGKTLALSLRESRPTADRAAELIQEISQGVAAIHAAGLLHRDLKPANILINPEGQPVIIDFGLAAHVGAPDADSISGTPAYMAREQARGDSKQLGPATDVFGLGAILFEMLTGRPPHQGDSSRATWQKAIDGEVASVETLAPQVPSKLAAICNRCLAADPRFRYGSASDLHTSLNQWLATQQQGRGFNWLWKLGRFRLRLSFGVSLAALLLAAIGWQLKRNSQSTFPPREVAQNVLNSPSAATAATETKSPNAAVEQWKVKTVPHNDMPREKVNATDVQPRLLLNEQPSRLRIQFQLDQVATSRERSTSVPPMPRSAGAQITASADCRFFVWHEIPGVEVRLLVPTDGDENDRLTSNSKRTFALSLPAHTRPLDAHTSNNTADSRLHILATRDEIPADLPVDKNPFVNPEQSPASDTAIKTTPRWQNRTEALRWKQTLQKFLELLPQSDYSYEVMPIITAPATP